MAIAIGSICAFAVWHFVRPVNLPPLAQAPTSGFRFSPGTSCDQQAYQDPIVRFTRANTFLRAEVVAVMNCSYRPANPQVLFTPQKVTLAIEESPTVDGYAAACLCGKSLIFDLYQPITAGTLVVLQQNGNDAARGRAP